MSLGLDYVTGPPIVAMQSAGVTFVCRYLSEVNDATRVKILTAAEAKMLSAAGIAIVSNFEWTADRALGGAAAGVADAQIARDQHAACGGPDTRPIYFSVDFDAQPSQMPAIIDYFKGVASVIGLHRTGAYGGYNLIKGLFDAGVITWGWQTYAWSGGKWDDRAHIQQYSNSETLGGASVDYNRSMAVDFGQWLIGGNTPVPTTTTGGENAVFIDNITQLEGGESEDACVAFSCANVFYSTQPGTANHHTPEDVGQLADKWYTHETGSITSSAGLSVPQLDDVLNGMGLHWESIPITSNGPANDEAVRMALRAGKLVIVCAAESSFFDLEIGRPPYSWNTQPYNHCIVVTGNITSGPYTGNVWVRDTVAVSGGYPPSTRRPYDLAKMQYVSLTAVTPAWLRGDTSMSTTLVGWKDDGVTLTAPNGISVVHGFRQYILNNSWDAADVPLVLESAADPVEIGYQQPSGGQAGTRQVFMYSELCWTAARGVFRVSVGREFATALAKLASVTAPTPAPVDTTQALADVQSIADDVAAAVAAGVAKAVVTIKKL